jgi:hypothetical protein
MKLKQQVKSFLSIVFIIFLIPISLKICGVLKSDEKSANGSKHTPSSATQGQLQHVAEDSVEDSVPELPDDDVYVEDTDNDTNEDALPYFARVTNNFLRLVKTSPDSLVS